MRQNTDNAGRIRAVLTDLSFNRLKEGFDSGSLEATRAIYNAIPELESACERIATWTSTVAAQYDIPEWQISDPDYILSTFIGEWLEPPPWMYDFLGKVADSKYPHARLVDEMRDMFLDPPDDKIMSAWFLQYGTQVGPDYIVNQTAREDFGERILRLTPAQLLALECMEFHAQRYFLENKAEINARRRAAAEKAFKEAMEEED